MPVEDGEWPKEGEVLMCTVKKVEKFGAFLTLDEYGGKEGFIHISEVSPNWVKNIRDFFKEGRKVVAKVTRVDVSKQHIDMSLKRTTEQRKRYKVQQWKQRQKSTKLLELASKKVGKTPEQAKTEVVDKLLSEYPDLYTGFEEVVVGGKEVLAKRGIAKDWIEALYPIIVSTIELHKVEIEGYVSLQCFEPNGVEVIRGALSELTKPTDGEKESKIAVQIIGPPRYRVTVEAEDYKTAESILQKRIGMVESYLGKFDHTFAFSRPSK